MCRISFSGLILCFSARRDPCLVVGDISCAAVLPWLLLLLLLLMFVVCLVVSGCGCDAG